MGAIARIRRIKQNEMDSKEQIIKLNDAGVKLKKPVCTEQWDLSCYRMEFKKGAGKWTYIEWYPLEDKFEYLTPRDKIYTWLKDEEMPKGISWEAWKAIQAAIPYFDLDKWN